MITKDERLGKVYKLFIGVYVKVIAVFKYGYNVVDSKGKLTYITEHQFDNSHAIQDDILYLKQHEFKSLETAFDDHSHSDLDIDPQLQPDGTYNYVEVPLPLGRSDIPISEVEANDHQVGSDHYKKKAIQPWDFIISNNIGFLEGNAIKYLSRHKDKGGLEDVKKALHYIQKLIETYEDDKK